MSTLLRSQTTARLLFWAGLLTLIAGVVAFAVVRFGHGGENDAGAGQRLAPADVQPTEGGKLAPEARQVAAKFILTAVARKNLAESYHLVTPELRQGMTLRQWKSGNIPITYYDVGNLSQATFDVTETYPGVTELLVGLLPRKGSKVKAQSFDMEIKQVGKGSERHWVVSYFMPKLDVSVPLNPNA